MDSVAPKIWGRRYHPNQASVAGFHNAMDAMRESDLRTERNFYAALRSTLPNAQSRAFSSKPIQASDICPRQKGVIGAFAQPSVLAIEPLRSSHPASVYSWGTPRRNAMLLSTDGAPRRYSFRFKKSGRCATPPPIARKIRPKARRFDRRAPSAADEAAPLGNRREMRQPSESPEKGLSGRWADG